VILTILPSISKILDGKRFISNIVKTALSHRHFTLIFLTFFEMSRIKTAILFDNSTPGQLKVRAVNRAKSKHCWFDGSLVENNLPHFRVHADSLVAFSKAVSTSQTQNNDDFSSSSVGIEWGNSTWESFEDYNLGSSQYGDGSETNLWN
jgi:hypothetical protein